MLSAISAIGSLGLAALRTDSGKKVGKFMLKNAGKFIGKAGKWTADKLGKPEWSKKASGIAEQGIDVATKIFGQNNEVSKQLDSVSKELKGEKAELRKAEEPNYALSQSMNLQNPYDLSNKVPYISRLHRSNFKKYIPSDHLTKKVRIRRKKRKFKKE